MLQLNILSLVGVYRQSAQELADELLEAGLYDYVVTDVHNENMVNKIKAVHLSKKNLKRVEKLVQNNNLL